MEVKLVWDGDTFLIVDEEYEETETNNALVQLSGTYVYVYFSAFSDLWKPEWFLKTERYCCFSKGLCTPGFLLSEIAAHLKINMISSLIF